MSGLNLVRVLIAAFAVLCFSAAAAAPGETVLLVAKRQLDDDPLWNSTILIAKPVEGGGYVGFIVNKPTTMSLGEMFPEHAPSKKVADPLFLGGTVDINRVFALVERHASAKDSAILVAPDLFLAYDSNAVDHIIESESDHARFFLGLVVWRPGQLDDELERGLWYVQKPEAALVLRRKTDNLWEELVRHAEDMANSI
ncbi:MAG TPA: YqgE/AlgH family protein [Burkholderiales bacterium]|nr:YqgE/AlgH family protein [Burkholderiales bacterium]